MMKTHHYLRRPRSIRHCSHRAAPAFALPLALAAVWLAGGCEKHRDIPPMTVGTVTAYGLTLDADASPREVAFALLRSLHDDVEAAQAHDRKAQQEAFRTTFALAAFSTINARLAESFVRPDADTDSAAPAFRAERIYEIVNHWAPIVAYYVRSFDTDYEQAAGRMQVVGGGADAAEAIVLYPVQHDPDRADPEPGEPVLLEIDLVKEQASSGQERFWRVARVAFRGPMPVLIEPTTSPAPATSAP